MPDWQTVLAIDSDKWACAVYAANFPGVPVKCSPVSEWIGRLPHADVLLGGPPCQPHSTAGKRYASNDGRDCGPDFVAAVRKVRPRHFLMENVPGLLSSENGQYWRRLGARLDEAGYEGHFQVMDAVSFGVPQFRPRVWLWGIRYDLYDAGMRQRFPKPTHAWPPDDCMFGCPLLPGVTVRNAIGAEWWATECNTSSGMSKVPRSGDVPCTSIPAGEKLMGGLLRLDDPRHPVNDLDRPAVTQRSGGNGHSAPDHTIIVRIGNGWRRFTPEECGRIQSIPDSFVWPTDITKTQRHKITGNGWACAMADAMSRALAAVDPDSRTVIDLFCGGGLGAVGWHGRAWRHEPAERLVTA